MHIKYTYLVVMPSVLSLTLLAGRQEQHPTGKSLVMGCWYGYLSGGRCRLFAYVPANPTAIPKPYHFLPHLNPDWFYCFGNSLPSNK